MLEKVRYASKKYIPDSFWGADRDVTGSSARMTDTWPSRWWDEWRWARPGHSDRIWWPRPPRGRSRRCGPFRAPGRFWKQRSGSSSCWRPSAWFWRRRSLWSAPKWSRTTVLECSSRRHRSIRSGLPLWWPFSEECKHYY